MINKTKDLTLKVLEENKEMKSREILRELEKKGHCVNYDTICRNLNLMFKENLLNRYGKGKKINKNTRRRHWNFYYSLKK